VSGHVFISYSRADRVYVDKVAAHLRSADVTVWYDYELSAGDRFDAEIEQQILTCAAFVVVLSPASARSEWVRREIRFAQDQGKPVLPLLLEPCTGPIRLQELHRDDVQGGRVPPARFMDRLGRLTRPQPPADTMRPPTAAAASMQMPAPARLAEVLTGHTEPVVSVTCRRTGATSPPPAQTRRYGCGTPPPGPASAH
jgi:hypothetical protein